MFSDSLRIAEATPVYIYLCKLGCANYRPISLPPNLDKIIEKLMYKRIIGFLNDLKTKVGLKKKISTAHAVISLIENTEKAIDNKLFVCGVLVDLRKVFNAVDHNTLLQKLSRNGIRYLGNCWFSFHLSNRKQFVTINGFNSKM